MDFGSLLHVAQKNEKKPKNEIKYYSTKFEPPKKEERSKQLSDNIKKFLARKEAEEKQKAIEAQVRREELLALRSQDRKATRRVSVMLKRTKSANKSVISDAIDNDNTAVTLAGPSQPDEDDYGYVSQEASAFYNKMMQKYNTTPEDDKFSKSKKNTNTNLKEIKDRVRAALLKEQEDALLPHKRKRRPKEDGTEEEEDRNEVAPEKKEKPKPRPAPPPLNFNDLLKIAEKKQFEPIKIEPKVVEEGRLMTKKQKREFEKEQAWKERKEKGTNDSQKMPPPNKIPKLSSNPSNGRIPKLNEDRSTQKIPKLNPNNSITSTSKQIPKKPDERISKPNNIKLKRPDDRPPIMKKTTDVNKVSKLRTELEKNRINPSVNKPVPSNSKTNTPLSEKNKGVVPKPKPKQFPPQDLKPKKFPPQDLKPKQFPPSDLKPKQFPPPDLKPKQFPPPDLKPKQFPPPDLKPKQFPPQDIRPNKFPQKTVKRKPPMGHKRRILDDDDSEYDSEMDDFIDDGPEGQEDYSKYISEIFGYDKSRYRNEDYDDAGMEASFSQVMREEFISGKIGLMEDLEDMKLEAEEKKRKSVMKKKMMRK